jgi:hypothetical protein
VYGHERGADSHTHAQGVRVAPGSEMLGYEQLGQGTGGREEQHSLLGLCWMTHWSSWKNSGKMVAVEAGMGFAQR